MTEYELVTLMTEARDRSWLMIQIWSGISFGYMAYAQYSSDKINTFIVFVLSALYASFSLMLFQALSAAHAASKACEHSLRELALEAPLTTATEAFFASNNFGIATETASSIAIFGTTLCAFLYLPYVYYKSKRKNT